ncbi:hypothetical protein EVG20_g11109 [Dentipellis fragilis]|uniref:HMG box domain-containing protein n=1 Tax=Dentipellis fragilis TaxID=205917 RepID=A0A4Y9XPS5_9AGAM|nr:hypothetical protein EVG20_g11109 [Dentipellis fragilis]
MASTFTLMNTPIDIGVTSIANDFPSQTKSSTTSASKADKKTKIPRPCNCWLLFRKAKLLEINKSRPASERPPPQKVISKLVSSMWKKLSVAQRAHWEAAAAREVIEHKKKYPGYKYAPQKKAAKEGGKQKKKRAQERANGGPKRRHRTPPKQAPQQINAEAGPSRASTETVCVPHQHASQNVQFEFPADPAPAVQTDDEYITELLALVPNPPLDFDRDWQSAQQEVDRLYSPRVPSEDADELRYPVLQLYL